jgi:hypothetical protein
MGPHETSSNSAVGYGFEVDLPRVKLAIAAKRWKKTRSFTRALPSLVELCVQAALLSPDAAGITTSSAWTARNGLKPFAAVLTTGRFDKLPNYAALHAAGATAHNAEEDRGGKEWEEDEEEDWMDWLEDMDDPDVELHTAQRGKQMEDIVNVAALRILGPALFKRLSQEKPAAAAPASGAQPESKPPKVEKEVIGPVVAVPMHALSSMYDDDDDMGPETALFLFLGPACQRTRYLGNGGVINVVTFNPDAVDALGVWALTKVAFYLDVPLKQEAPAWLLADEAVFLM